ATCFAATDDRSRRGLRTDGAGRMRAAHVHQDVGSRGRMAIEVAKIELKTVQDASGLDACIARGQFAADEVIAVIGKTEANGAVQRVPGRRAHKVLARTIHRPGRGREGESPPPPVVGAGGGAGVTPPPATVFARNGKTGPASKSPLAMGPAMSAELLPEDIGR